MFSGFEIAFFYPQNISISSYGLLNITTFYGSDVELRLGDWHEDEDDEDGDNENTDRQDESDDEEERDARAREEAGADWMVEQGFDRKD